MTVSLTREQRIMGISGMLFALFLTLHLLINLTSLISREAYESAWRFINENMLSKMIFLVLVLGFLTHTLYGIIINIRNAKALKANRNKVEKKHKAQNVLKNMLSLGTIVVGLAALHLGQFWAKTQLHGESPYDIAKTLFYNDFYVAVYVAWIIALYYHLSYGFWNIFLPINKPNSKLNAGLQIVSKVFSALIAFGFILIPVYFYLGFGYA